jgi:hypothetical protein
MQEQVRLLIEREVRYAQVGAVDRSRQTPARMGHS